MKFAIISAGEGSRLAKEGIKCPKPLVPLQGTPIIERLIRIFCQHNAESVNIIINEQQSETLSLLQKLSMEYPINIIIKDTPSSMHSLYELSPLLQDGKFCLTTVDTIFQESDFVAFLETFEKSTDDGVMVVTPYIDDEKPLYVGTDSNLDITGFYDERHYDCNYISGGIYGLTSKTLKTLDKCMKKNIHKMRNFQRQLISDGLKLKAFPFDKIIDIDHADDIEKAEKFITTK